MKIVTLGWGSLIWDWRDLPISGGWERGDPVLAVEFNGLGGPAKSYALEYLHRAREEVMTPVGRAAIQAGLIPPPQPAQ